MTLNDNASHIVLARVGQGGWTIPATIAAPRPLTTNGRGLRKLLHGKPANVRTHIAIKLVTGEWQVGRLLPAQAARLCRISPPRLTEALGRPPRRRSDRDIDRIVIRLGIERVWTSIDRLTRPDTPANDNTATMQAAE